MGHKQMTSLKFIDVIDNNHVIKDGCTFSNLNKITIFLIHFDFNCVLLSLNDWSNEFLDVDSEYSVS